MTDDWRRDDGTGDRRPTGDGESNEQASPSLSRRILHCDMDCFYAAVHMRDDPHLAGRPVVIGGDPHSRGVVAAASYEARAFGIHSAMPATQAYRRCPQAVFLRPDFVRYRQEAALIFAIYRDFTPQVQTVSLDEAYLDVSEHLGELGTATAVARAVRARIRAERQLTVSVGVAANRLLAKIASDFKKPDGLTVVPPAQALDFLAPLPVRKLPGVGPVTERVLKELGADTLAELRALSRAQLVARLGRHGETLYRYARGLDERPVRTHEQRKSLGAERTFEHDLARLEAMDAELERLAQIVADGLGRRGLAGATVAVKVRYRDFTTVTRARTLKTATDDPRSLLAVACQLLRSTAAGKRPVRLLGVTVSKLARPGAGQLSLFAGEQGREAR